MVPSLSVGSEAFSCMGLYLMSFQKRSQEGAAVLQTGWRPKVKVFHENCSFVPTDSGVFEQMEDLLLSGRT